MDASAIDVIKHHKPADGVAEPAAIIITLGRELFCNKRVNAEAYARAQQVLGLHALAHMIALMSNYTMTSVIFAALDQQVAPDQSPLLPLNSN